MTRKQEYKERQKEGRPIQQWFSNSDTPGKIRKAMPKGDKAWPVHIERDESAVTA